MNADSPPEPTAGPPAEDGSEEERRRRVALQLQAGVRQRQAEVAALAGSGSGDNAATELLAAARLPEPLGVSRRRGLGGPLTALRKLAFHLLLKPYLRPLMSRVGSFQQLAAQRLAASQDRERELLRRLQELEQEVAVLREERGDP